MLREELSPSLCAHALRRRWESVSPSSIHELRLDPADPVLATEMSAVPGGAPPVGGDAWDAVLLLLDVVSPSGLDPCEDRAPDS